MKTPNETPEASYQAASKRDPVAISVKRDSDVANIIAAATAPSRSKSRKVKRAPQVKPTMKKPMSKGKKMSTFRITMKRK